MGLVALAAVVPFGRSADLVEKHFDSPEQPSYLIVTSRQRSSSSTLSRVLASHPCALHGNEIWTDGKTQDHLGAHQHTGMSGQEILDDPHLFLTSAGSEICAEAISDGTIPVTCGGQCTIVIKMFDSHGLSRDGIASLMRDSNMAFVVLEREVGKEYCSHLRATTLGDWGTTPDGHKKDLPPVDCDEVPRDFSLKHDRWFYRVRQELRLNERSFVDIPFALVASCGLQRLAESIYAMHGFSVPIEMQLSPDIDSLFSACV